MILDLRFLHWKKKAKAIALIEDYLSADIRSYEEELKEKKQEN